MFYLAAGDEMATHNRQVQPPFVLAVQSDEETDRHEATGYETCPTGALRSHRLETAVAKDKHPVQYDIEQITAQRDKHRHKGVA